MKRERAREKRASFSLEKVQTRTQTHIHCQRVTEADDEGVPEKGKRGAHYLDPNTAGGRQFVSFDVFAQEISFFPDYVFPKRFNKSDGRL